MTKQTFAGFFKKAIPVVGGVIDGGITFATFKPCCDRLKEFLRDTILNDPEHEFTEAEKLFSRKFKRKIYMLRLHRKMRFQRIDLKTRDKNIFDHNGSGEEYFCTRCNATLNIQTGFDPSLDTWVCRECGQFLFGNVPEGEKYPGVMWYCDRCGDLLNKQEGFTDTGSTWICEKCQYDNPLGTIVEFKNPSW